MSDHFDQTRDSEKGGDLLQFLTFTIGSEEFGVDIMTVREIKGWTETTRLPNSPECMRGVMNLRGIIIPIFDLRARFGKGLTEANASHVIIILAVAGRNIGILVDGVSDILSTPPEEVKPAPDLDGGAISEEYIAGLISREERMVVLLEVNHLFDASELPRQLTEAA